MLPKKTKTCCALQPCPAQFAAPPAQLWQIWGIFPSPVPPQEPQLSQSSSWGWSDRSPRAVWWFCCFYGTPAPTGNPYKPHSSIPWFLSVARGGKSIWKGEEGSVPQAQDSTTPNLPSEKGQEFPCGKAGIMALGHSAQPLLMSPAQTCPAPASPHKNTKYLRILTADMKQKRDDEMGVSEIPIFIPPSCYSLCSGCKKHLVVHENS